MSHRLLINIGIALTALLVLVNAPIAFAGDNEGQFGKPTTSASTSRNDVSVAVRTTQRKLSATTTTDPPAINSAPTTTTTNPSQPYNCTYKVLNQKAQELLGPGGSEPGLWEFPICKGPGAADPMAPIWIVTGAVATAPIAEATVAQQAKAELPLPAPSIEMAPPANTKQLVNVAAWLWVNPASWHVYSITATVDGIAATATATPEDVIWNTGDDNTLTCIGPGTPHDPSSSGASSDCTYTWTTSSADQPGEIYEVTATIQWRVTWTAVGAPGGGDLGLIDGPPAHASIQVATSEALNASSASGGGGA